MYKHYIILIICCLLTACLSEQSTQGDLTDIDYKPIPYTLPSISSFPKMEIPTDNPMTEAGILLGRRLFYDPILSVDSTKSCNSCHQVAGSFTDNEMVSQGVGGTLGKRSSMSLLNVGFHYKGFFWDGRTATLESQALIPIEDPVELKATWEQVEKKLQNHLSYPTLFRQAFGINNRDEIDRTLVVKAIAQFERTLVSSGTSKYDLVKKGLATFTPDEAMGEDLFFDNKAEVKDAECGNCHNLPLFTTNEYANNGLDEVDDIANFTDKGYGLVTNNKYDNGKFKIPGLRNVALSAPYMHDGRFNTLEEVLAHYNHGGHPSPTVHPLIRPLDLTAKEQQQIIAFLHTLTDSTFILNENYHNPF